MTDCRSTRVAVVVPARNEEHRLQRCISSIKEAARVADVAIELVVIDDCSTDNTSGIATEAGVVLLRQSVRRGPLAAWALGVSQTTAPFVFFVDADCSVDPHAFQHLLRNFAHDDIGLVAARSVPALTCRATYPGIVERSALFSATLLDHIKRRLDNHDFLPIGRLMALRRAALTILRTDRAPCDRAIAQWAKEQGWRIVYARDAIVYYEAIETYAQLAADVARSHARNALPLDVDPLPYTVLLAGLAAAFIAEPVQGAAWLLCHGALRLAQLARSHPDAPNAHVVWDMPSRQGPTHFQ